MLQLIFHKYFLKTCFIFRFSYVCLFSLSALMKEWPEETYPPWAHGPGYVVSHDIGKAVYKRYKEGRLKVG